MRKRKFVSTVNITSSCKIVSKEAVKGLKKNVFEVIDNKNQLKMDKGIVSVSSS